MANLKLILRKDKDIRGKIVKAGTILLDGECRAGIKPSDVEKAIQLGQLRVEIVTETGKQDKQKSADKVG